MDSRDALLLAAGVTAGATLALLFSSRKRSSSSDQNTKVDHGGRVARGYANGPHGQVHFYDTGGGEDGRPAVILCHQSPMTARQFDAVYLLLYAEGYRAIGVDNPGFGGSDPPTKLSTIRDYATAVIAVMDHLKLSKVDIAGHHTGAEVATELSIIVPDRVRCVVLNGPSPMDDNERKTWHEWVTKNEEQLHYAPDGSHLQQIFQRKKTKYFQTTDPKTLTRIVAEQFTGRGSFWHGHKAAFNYHHGDELRKMPRQQSVLILTSPDDILHPHSKRAHAIRPDFAFVEVKEGGGIDLPGRLPAVWVDAVTTFLANACRE